MSWDQEAENILPENDEEFDATAAALALENERTRRFARLFADTPRWLDDVA